MGEHENKINPVYILEIYYLCNLKGGGQPLPEFVRAYIELRFGYDFSGAGTCGFEGSGGGEGVYSGL